MTRLAWLVIALAAFTAGCDSEEDPTSVVLPDGGAVGQCNDGIDNDGDGLTDFPDDPECRSAEHPDEADGSTTQCADGEDNDDDGRIDLEDLGCDDSADDDESDEVVPQCADGEDNDGDGQIDLEDRGCASARDDDEGDEPPLPQCFNGIDDDEDGYTDFPQDPGCASETDDDEGDEIAIEPQCGDGIDNDNDGRVDIADPGCTSAADPRESDPDSPPQCFNNIDDDNNGFIDFPDDPGCSAAGDDEELALPAVPHCANGLDDDNDGLTDYPNDPGCAGVGDRDENDGRITPQCADTIDNDRDGRIDYPDDTGCAAAGDVSENGQCGGRYQPGELVSGNTIRGSSRMAPFESEGSCGGRGAPEVVFTYRVDRVIEALEITTELEGNALESVIYVRRGCLNPGSEILCQREAVIGDEAAGQSVRLERPSSGLYYIFLDGAAGRGGDFAIRVTEVPLAQCLNGIDDDDDGRTDYPLDPGCDTQNDRDETDPAVSPQCTDTEDNDGDGQVDFPLDFGCQSAADNDEVDVCGQGIRIYEYPVDEPFILDATDVGASNAFSGSCGNNAAPEKVFRYENRFNANLTISVDYPETQTNTMLYARANCGAAAELGCDTGEAPSARGRLELERVPPGEIFIFVDARIGIGGPFKLSVDVERLPPGCSDQIDNDEDGFIDADDAGCETPEDEDERDPDAPAVCSDRVDNDEDGLTDYPFDPGCVMKGGASEDDPADRPECTNDIDDDEDGLTDFPNDPGCSAAGDNSEAGDRVRPQCNNRVDDDQDGLTDYPNDPGCTAAGDLSEADDELPPACSDEIDNDRDGLVDFPFEPGCAAAGDTDEENPEPAFICSNGLDDDEDGIVDFPRDPGCAFAGDNDEADAAFAPQCANGLDDDGNGRIDWPDDPGCSFAADTRETTSGPVPTRCTDGVDNDDDGLVDLADVGCAGVRDDDEADPEVPPLCADEIDNDEDGAIDWPEDEGCAAQGDECEQFGHGQCEGVCLDLQNDAANCGVCGRVCEAGVECIEGFCGGLFTFEGIRQNVPDVDLASWEECHSSRFNEQSPIADMLARCDGELVMLGCRPAGDPNWTLVAQGRRDVVFQDSGQLRDAAALHDDNGVSWYFSGTYSLGFVAPGTGVSRNSCDTENASPELRMCWHSGGGNITSGYRCGRTTLNGNNAWERKAWTSQ